MLSFRKSGSYKVFLGVLTMVITMFGNPFQADAQNDHNAHHSTSENTQEGVQAHPGHSSGHGHEHCVIGEDNTADHIIHHIADSHDWHIFETYAGTCPDGHKMYHPIGVNLPWFVYNSDKGFEFFTTSGAEERGYAIHHGKLSYQNAEASVLDLSITKTSLHILLVFILLTIVMMQVVKGFKKNEGKAPKGIQSFFEPIIIFIRDEIGVAYLGAKSQRFMPFLLTVFFFIWFANLLGLTPFNSNIAGNIYVTIALALVSFIVILMNSTKDFWMHIFWFPGVPVPLKLLMLVVELMGLITKPVALAIRLFANIAAGHFMVLSLVGLIFILGKNGASPAGGFGITPLSVSFALFIFSLEMLVALIQAFVFTLLTAVFISQAMETHSHEHEHAEGAHGYH